MTELYEVAAKILSLGELTLGDRQYTILNCVVAATDEFLRCNVELGDKDTNARLTMALKVDRVR